MLVFTSMFTCFTARSNTTSAFTHLFVNPWLWGAIALSVRLQVAVVNLAFLNLAFDTVPLEFQQWLLCAAMASVVLWFSELRKLVIREWGRWGITSKQGLRCRAELLRVALHHL